MPFNLLRWAILEVYHRVNQLLALGLGYGQVAPKEITTSADVFIAVTVPVSGGCGAGHNALQKATKKVVTANQMQRAQADALKAKVMTRTPLGPD